MDGRSRAIESAGAVDDVEVSAVGGLERAACDGGVLHLHDGIVGQDHPSGGSVDGGVQDQKTARAGRLDQARVGRAIGGGAKAHLG